MYLSSGMYTCIVFKRVSQGYEGANANKLWCIKVYNIEIVCIPTMHIPTIT